MQLALWSLILTVPPHDNIYMVVSFTKISLYVRAILCFSILTFLLHVIINFS